MWGGVQGAWEGRPLSPPSGANDGNDCLGGAHVGTSDKGGCVFKKDAPGGAALSTGARVRVLPGRQFKNFRAGDVGVVAHVDNEGRTCEVRFDGRSGAERVAWQYLTSYGGPSDPQTAAEGAVTPAFAANIAIDDAATAGELSPSAWPTSPPTPGGHSCAGGSSSRLRLMDQVARLESAHKAEVADLRRALDDALALGHKQQRSVAAATVAAAAAEKAGTARRRSGTSSSPKRHESKDVGGSFPSSPAPQQASGGDASAAAAVVSASTSASQTFAAVWGAVREINERLVKEAESRASLQQEMLGVLGQGVQQLRLEQAQNSAECVNRAHKEHRGMRQRYSEFEERLNEHEGRLNGLDTRLEALIRRLADETGVDTMPTFRQTFQSSAAAAATTASGSSPRRRHRTVREIGTPAVLTATLKHVEGRRGGTAPSTPRGGGSGAFASGGRGNLSVVTSDATSSSRALAASLVGGGGSGGASGSGGSFGGGGGGCPSGVSGSGGDGVCGTSGAAGDVDLEEERRCLRRLEALEARYVEAPSLGFGSPAGSNVAGSLNANSQPPGAIFGHWPVTDTAEGRAGALLQLRGQLGKLCGELAESATSAPSGPIGSESVIAMAATATPVLPSIGVAGDVTSAEYRTAWSSPVVGQRVGTPPLTSRTGTPPVPSCQGTPRAVYGSSAPIPETVWASSYGGIPYYTATSMPIISQCVSPSCAVASTPHPAVTFQATMPASAVPVQASHGPISQTVGTYSSGTTAPASTSQLSPRCQAVQRATSTGTLGPVDTVRFTGGSSPSYTSLAEPVATTSAPWPSQGAARVTTGGTLG